MIDSVDAYINALKRELRGADRALIQDAVADAREYLSNALAAADSDSTTSGDLTLQTAISDFGTPAEIALAYQEIERRVPVKMGANSLSRAPHTMFFAVYRDIRAWSGLLYMVICALLSAAYFLWTFFGLAFSLTFSIFIIGLPLALAFLFSIRGIALLEGRVVEGLLGIRMPRRPVFFPRNTGWLDQLRGLMTDKHTWLTLGYTSLLWVLGFTYLCLILLIAGGGLVLIALPVVQEWTGQAVLSFGEMIYVPRWLYPISVLAGLVIVTAFLHLARAVGRLHGRLAKALLVGETME